MQNQLCSARIKSLYNTFSKTEKNIADYILQNAASIPSMPISELSSELDVGKASILRFCNKLELNGYKELKISLARETPSEKGLIYSNRSNNSLDGLLDEVTSENIATLQVSRQKVLTKDIANTADILLNSDNLLILANGFSSLLAQIAKYKFMKLGINCDACSDYQFQSFSIVNMSENGVILLIDLSGSLGELRPLIELSKSKNLKIIAIVNYEQSEITDIADIVILTEATESPLKDGELTAMLSQINIIDMLYTLMANKHEDIQLKRLDIFEDLIIKQQTNNK